MAKYEIVREIFNKCSGNQMRDVFVEEADIEDIDEYMNRYRTGTCEEESHVEPNGCIVYDLVVDGLKSRVSFDLL